MYPREIVLKYYTFKPQRMKEKVIGCGRFWHSLRITKRYICAYNQVHMYHTMKMCVGMGLKLNMFITLTLG